MQVMHSLRLLSLVSRTAAPMHSLPTRSRYKTSSSCTFGRGRREENGDGVAAYTASVPGKMGRGTGGGGGGVSDS